MKLAKYLAAKVCEASGIEPERTGTRYKNRPVTTEDGWFSSQRELRAWVKLKALQSQGTIADLKRRGKEVRFDLVVNGIKVTHYTADFVFTDCTGLYGTAGARVVADAKGARTKDYTIRWRLMKALYGIEIVEI